MKTRWLIALVIVLAILVGAFILYAVFFRTAPTPAHSSLNPNLFADAVETGTANQEVSPATFSINFFKWYIGNRETNSNFPSTSQLTSEFTQWTTTDFILHYQSTVSDPNNDADPILYAQDDPSGWGSGITATILNQTSSTSSVQVVIGSGSLAHTYKVQLVQSNGHWLVDSVSRTS